MGHKFSAVAGVKSDRYYEPGNAINEVWVGDVEILSRLPFGDTAMNQAAWPKGGLPKIPWKDFIIPLKRDLGDDATPVNKCVEVCHIITITVLAILAAALWNVPARMRQRFQVPDRMTPAGSREWRKKSTILIGHFLFFMTLGSFAFVAGAVLWANLDSRLRQTTLESIPGMAVAATLGLEFVSSARQVYWAWKVWRRAHQTGDLESHGVNGICMN